jgi:hypothetical protein
MPRSGRCGADIVLLSNFEERRLCLRIGSLGREPTTNVALLQQHLNLVGQSRPPTASCLLNLIISASPATTDVCQLASPVDPHRPIFDAEGTTALRQTLWQPERPTLGVSGRGYRLSICGYDWYAAWRKSTDAAEGISTAIGLYAGT